MGLFSYFFKRKKSISGLLEDLEENIQRLEDTRKSNLALEKQIVGSLILYSVLTYIVAAIFGFIYYFPDSDLFQRILFTLPLLGFPFLVFAFKKFLHWYFVRRVHQNDNILKSLRVKKTKLLEEVMDKETYKKAKEILERYDPSLLNKMDNGAESLGSRDFVSSSVAPDTELRRRSLSRDRVSQSVTKQPAVKGSVPGSGLNPSSSVGALDRSFAQPAGGRYRTPLYTPLTGRNGMMKTMGPPPATPTARMARPVLPRERGRLDWVIDMLVGDGPDRRFALICAGCSSHNGMALAEEFEYLAFRCCYCQCWNPPRKTRPFAPSLSRGSSLDSVQSESAVVRGGVPAGVPSANSTSTAVLSRSVSLPKGDIPESLHCADTTIPDEEDETEMMSTSKETARPS